MDWDQKGKLKLLFIEDEKDSSDRIVQDLKKWGLDFSVRVVLYRGDEWKEPEEQNPDIVILGCHGKKGQTGDLFEMIKRKYPSVPVIILMDSVNDDEQAEYMQRGASACISADSLDRLPISVYQALLKKSAGEPVPSHDDKNRELRSFYNLDIAMEYGKPIPVFLTQASGIILPGLRFPDAASCMITLGGKEYRSGRFEDSGDSVTEIFQGVRWTTGKLILYYEKGYSFSPGEIEFTHAFAQRINSYIMRLRSKEALIESEHKFHTMFNCIKDGVLIADVSYDGGIVSDYICVDANSSFFELFQLNRMESVRSTGSAIFGTDDPFLPCFRTFFENGRSSFEARYRPLDRYLLISVSAMTEKTIIVVVLDLSEKKVLEEQLIQAQKMESVGQLAGGVAHDFNNYLMAILSFATLLDMKMGDDKKMKGYVTQIIDACNKAASVAQSLLLFSRREEIQMQPIQMRVVLQDIIKLIKQILGKEVEVFLDVGDDHIVVSGDMGRLHQVVVNLATNARDAMEGKGILNIRLRRVTPSDLVLRKYGIKGGGAFACVSVSDTGCGMTEEVRKKLFEPFFTTKDVGKGTGLGMSISFGIIKQHGGFIEVDSFPGRGTTFDVYLPLSNSTADSSGREKIQDIKGGGERILLVDDQEEVRSSLKGVLQQIGYRVQTAGDGDYAISLFRENPEGYDIVLLDVRLPYMDGREVCVALRKIRPDIGVLFMSGYSMGILERDFSFDEKTLVVMKPLEIPRLTGMIRRVIEAAG